MIEAVRRLSPRPIRHIVLTSGGDQQAGGAAKLSKAGRYIRVIDDRSARHRHSRLDHGSSLNVLNRMNADNVPPTRGRPTRITPEWSIFSNGEAANPRRVGAQRRRHDRLLQTIRRHQHWRNFRRERISAFRSGTRRSIAGVIEGLNRVLDIAVREKQEGGTVVPGRGRLSDETDVANYRDMVTIIRDRVRAMVAKGCRSSRCSRLNRRRITTDCSSLAATGRARCSVDAIYRDLTKSESAIQLVDPNNELSSLRCSPPPSYWLADRWPGRRVGAAPRRSADHATSRCLDRSHGPTVSVITEDWRWRMVTPPKGDTASVPLNPAGRKIADAEPRRRS